MKKIIFLVVSLLFSLGSFAQETKVIKDGKKVTKEQVEANKKKLQNKKKQAEKNAATAKKKQDKNGKEAKQKVANVNNSNTKATEVKSKVKKTAAQENDDLKQTAVSKAAEKKVTDKVTGEYKGKKVFTGPKGGKYYINKNGNKTYID
ncbi:MAG: hypothetical protein NWQ14_03050 [Flavobacterium sp.]|nr:hypothetical protein [Flavobacterium sp.]MDP5027175.1 hypothetical protein [Flavobacterium sp.]